jgi:20S proteasome alpha/beta subunit
MAIALGLPCRDGLIICADEQVLAEGASKYQEERIFCLELFGTVFVSSYAGVPGLWKEATEKISRKLSELQGPDEEGDVCVTPHAIYDSADEVFTAMGRPANLQMVMAVGGVFGSPELFVFDRGAMHRAPSFTCVGAGESSVIRYLADNLYSPDMSLEAAKNLGIYLISIAAQYIHGVGSPMDAVVVRGHQPEWLGDTEIRERETALRGREKSLLRQVLSPPFSSSASWP